MLYYMVGQKYGTFFFTPKLCKIINSIVVDYLIAVSYLLSRVPISPKVDVAFLPPPPQSSLEILTFNKYK